MFLSLTISENWMMNLGFEEPLWDVELFGRLTFCLPSSDCISLASCLQVCVGHPLLLCLDYFGAFVFSVIIYFMTIWAVPLMRNSFTALLKLRNPTWVFQMSISYPFDELHGWNLDYKLNTPWSINRWHHFWTMPAILDFVKNIF